jgi:hypothetical protein
MNKEELITENTLLRQQNEILSKQIEKLMPEPATWRTLIGKVWNLNADTQMKEWTRQARLLSTLLEQQNVQAQEGAPIEKWTPLHQLRLDAYKRVLRQPDTIHAFCEYRERQRNAQLGEPPTISELAEILDNPEQKNPEVDKVSFSETPAITRQVEPITTDFLPHR